MLNFVKTAFREFVEVLLWIILIGCAIAGYMLGSFAHSDGGAVIGLVVGVVVGFLVCIFGGGYIATLIEMGNDLAIIKAAIAKTGTSNPVLMNSSVMSDPTLMNSSVTPDPVLMNSSMLINSGKALCGNLTRENKRNLFHVILAQSGKLSINLTSDDEDGLPHWGVYVNVLDASGKKINTSGRFEFPYNCELDLPNAGTYVIEITSSNTGRYYLTAQY